MAGEKLLTEAQCRAAKPKGTVYYLNDGGGLRFRVRPNGSRHWLFRYRRNGQEQTASLGTYPHVSLKDARERKSEARRTLSHGKDPLLERAAAKARVSEAAQNTFQAVSQLWLENKKPVWSANHYKRNEGILRRLLTPTLGKLPIESISEKQLFLTLKPFYDAGTKESARKARAVARQIFAHGRALHLCTNNPARDMADNPYFAKPTVKHFTALAQEDVSALVAQLRPNGVEQRLKITTSTALLMALYTGLRDSSIRGARWSEIDLQNALWSVPAGNMKSRRPHRVPLPRQAVAAFRELERYTFLGPDSFVFASHGKSGHLAENTLRIGLHRLGFKVTVHGMRSLMTDVLNEAGFASDLIEKQLDHQLKGVKAAYLRTEFLEQRRAMIQWYADWCDQTALKSSVVQFRSRV